MRFIFEIIRKILARVNYFLLIWKLIFSTAFKKIKYREKFKFLLITPEHCNLGDHAIAAAEEALFKDFFLFEITERSLDKFFKYFRHSLSLKLLFGKSDILIHGGGFIGTIWPYSDILTQQIIELLPHSRIILLPNTIFFSDDEEGRKRAGSGSKMPERSIIHIKILPFAQEKSSPMTMRSFCSTTTAE